jgi:hypothetical protein
MVVWLPPLDLASALKKKIQPAFSRIGTTGVVDGYFVDHKPNPTNATWERFRMEEFSSGAYGPLTSPDFLDIRVASA